MTDVKRLLAEATPLPWAVARGGFGGMPLWVEAPEHIRYPDGSGPRIIHLGGSDESAEPDAALIVHAVNSLPAYEEAVEALERLVEAVACSDSDSTQVCMICDRRIDNEPDWCWRKQGRAALARLRGDA